jgi:toxin ParE1/3/4
MRHLVFRPRAEAEIRDARRTYEQSRTGLGKAFAEAVDIAVDGIVRNPLLHARVFGETRRVFVRGYPYQIFFRVTGARIVVVAVMHDRQHPRRWQRRACLVGEPTLTQSRERKR